jgi:GntR family transcriptional regulator
MALEIHITTGSQVPIYRQVIDQIRVAVAIGDLGPGEALPSVRALAQHLVVNPNTVAKAYNELTREGVVESRPGRGVFVAEERRVLAEEERLRRLQVALDRFLQQGIGLGFSGAELRRAVDDALRGIKHRKSKRAVSK